MTNFGKWDKAFQSNNLSAFNHNEKALLYLKVRAICRGKLIKQFTEKYQLELKSTKVNDQFSELYSLLENNPNGKNMPNAFAFFFNQVSSLFPIFSFNLFSIYSFGK